MRLKLLMGGMIAALLWSGGPAFAQKSGGTLRMFHRDNPPSASIHEESTASTVVPFMGLFNNLVRFDPAVAQNSEKSIIPDLAESWSWNADRTELSFRLHRGVTWHDGRPFTSRDVECTFNLLTGRAANKLRRNPRGAWYRNINFVNGTGDHDVTIHLNRPQPALLSLLASGFTPIYPCHISPTQMRTRPVGTGPFRLDTFTPFERIRLVRNPDYWKPGRPYLDGVEFTIVTSPSTALLSFTAGRFDMTFPWEVSVPQLKDAQRQTSRAVCQITPMNNNTNLLINREAPPFNNPDIRRALGLAIDRRAFIDGLGEGDVGSTFQPPAEGMWGLPPDMLAEVPGFGPDIEKNREEARALMAKAGYSRERPMTLKVATRGIPLYRAPATILVKQLKEIHIDATLDIVETSLWFTRLNRREYSVGVNTTGNGVDDPDQSLYENYACRSERNYNGYCNPALERLFDVQSAEADPEKRRRLVWEIDAKLLADGARPPIVWNSAATCWQPHVKGYVPFVNGMYNGFRFEDVWLDR
ncbi:MAG: ABC transporter substrate-binding protein [Reyranella sp.]|nr:ABC transporter substrate-binding protein [Reyranella sp.]